MNLAQVHVQVLSSGEAAEADVALVVARVELGAVSQLHGQLVEVADMLCEMLALRVAAVTVLARELALVLRLRLLQVLAYSCIRMLLGVVPTQSQLRVNALIALSTINPLRLQLRLDLGLDLDLDLKRPNSEPVPRELLKALTKHRVQWRREGMVLKANMNDLTLSS